MIDIANNFLNQPLMKQFSTSKLNSDNKGEERVKILNHNYKSIGYDI